MLKKIILGLVLVLSVGQSCVAMEGEGPRASRRLFRTEARTDAKFYQTVGLMAKVDERVRLRLIRNETSRGHLSLVLAKLMGQDYVEAVLLGKGANPNANAKAYNDLLNEDEGGFWF